MFTALTSWVPMLPFHSMVIKNKHDPTTTVASYLELLHGGQLHSILDLTFSAIHILFLLVFMSDNVR